MAKDDRGPELAAATIVLLALSTITVALRAYVRTIILKSFSVDDWLALATLTSFAFYSTCVLISVKHGAGKHLADVPPDFFPTSLKARYFGELAYVVTSVLLKFTVGLFLLRICSRRWQRVTIWVVLYTIFIFNVIYMGLAIFQCSPVDYFWRKATHDIQGHCLDKSIISGSTYAAMAINGWADWTLGLLPLALVWKLELGKRTKASVAGILALGIVASTATLVRITYIWQLTHDEDVLWVFTDFAIWSTLENGLGLTASSIATLRPLFKKFLSKSRRGTYPAPRGPSRQDAIRLTAASKGGSRRDRTSASPPPAAHIRDKSDDSDLESALGARHTNEGYEGASSSEWRTASGTSPVSARTVGF